MSLPLSCALAPIRTWRLSLSEAKEGYNRLIHPLICLGMARSHYMGNTVSGVWVCGVVRMSVIYFSNAGPLFSVRTLCFTFPLDSSWCCIVVGLLQSERTTDVAVHRSGRDKNLQLSIWLGITTHNIWRYLFRANKARTVSTLVFSCFFPRTTK